MTCAELGVRSPLGSGFHLFVTNYTAGGVFAPDGTQLNATKDSNGNYSSTSGTGYTPSVLTDTLGRNVVARSTSGNYIYYDVLNSQGGTSRYTITTESIPIWSAWGTCCNGYIDYHGSILVVQSFQLPDGTSYSFQYDSGTTQGHYGTLTSMTLPTGGQISYSYGTFLTLIHGISTRTTPDSATPWKYSLNYVQYPLPLLSG